MIVCPACQHPVQWWVPLTTWRDEVISCPHCGAALRLDRSRYHLLIALTIGAIAFAPSVETAHPYLLILGIAAAAVVAWLLFAKVVPAGPDDDARGS